MTRKITLMTTMLLALALAAPAFAQHHHGGMKKAPAEPAKDEAKKPPVAFNEPPPVGTKATCPVMGNVFTVTEKTQRAEYEGKHYVFCCKMCKPKFEKDPEKYAKAAAKKDGHGDHGEGHGHHHGGHPAP